MAINLTPYFSILRQAASMTGGMLIAFNIKGADPNAITGGVDHIINGASEIALGIGMLLPTASAVWGAISGTRKAKITAAAADPDVARVLINTDATGPAAEVAADPNVPKVGKAFVGHQ